ncbi:MAG: right-handed parallel beta-helix repeat-containing protein, partial [Candidatus Eisenbacteria sp.]|nr:right-handed parallel beta-helix repeat-containing protein [Candidatus Eisenbacteria bacterium]
MRYFLLTIGLLLITTGSATGTTYVVSPDGTGDFPTIQAAIDSVLDGDIIELANGMFTGEGNRDIDYLGKAISIRSQAGDPDSCLIGCAYSARGFIFHSGEGHDSILEGVTIAYGYAGYEEVGGGILCSASSPSIVNCVVRNCTALRGGGIRIEDSESAPHIDGCTIDSNSADLSGGGISAYGSLTLTNCTIIDNTTAEHGGGASLHGTPVVRNCTFVGNSGINAIAYGFPEPVTFQGVIVAFSFEGKAMCSTLSPDVTPTLICCDLFANPGGDWVDQIADQYGVLGNISEDPLFCDLEARDLTLHEDSPCAPFTPPNPGCDLIGAYPVGCAPMAVPVTPAPPAPFLNPAAPNPFTGATLIRYSVPTGERGAVALSVCDATGRLVRTLIDGPQAPGRHAVQWDGTAHDGRQAPAGVYF